MRALRRGPPDARRRVDPELVRLDVPARHGAQRARTPRRSATQQTRPRRARGDLGLDGLEPAFEAAVQRVVGRRLPVRAVRRARERGALEILHEAGMPPRAIAAAVAQVQVLRQRVPARRERREPVRRAARRARATSAAVSRAWPSPRSASVAGLKQVPADELDGGVELEVLVRLLGEAVPLVVGEQVPDRLPGSCGSSPPSARTRCRARADRSCPAR